MVKIVHVLNTDMERLFFFFMLSPSMCTHFEKKCPLLFGQRVLCAAGSAIRSTDQPHTHQSSQLINLLYQLPSAWSSLKGGDSFVFQEFSLSPQQIISLFAAEGNRRSVLFFVSQSSILLAFSQSPFKQHHPAESGKPAAESEVKGM